MYLCSAPNMTIHNVLRSYTVSVLRSKFFLVLRVLKEIALVCSGKNQFTDSSLTIYEVQVGRKVGHQKH